MRDVSGLSKREIQVAMLYAIGHTGAEIAGMLYRSPKTIHSHKAHIRKKRSIKTSVEWMTFLREFTPLKEFTIVKEVTIGKERV